MIVAVYILILVLGMAYAVKVFAAELNWQIRLPDFKLPRISSIPIKMPSMPKMPSLKMPRFGKPALRRDTVAVPIPPSAFHENKPSVPFDIPEPPVHHTPEKINSAQQMEKIDIMLSEKNKEINRLQTELQSYEDRWGDVEKVKTLLEEEIQKLREQNRTLKSELILLTDSRSNPQDNV